MNLAVIPARGGSTRIAKKNIKDFLGKPIISYSIEAAIKSGIFDRIIVSTDSEEIAKIARQAGAETPFTRPDQLSKNSVNIADVIKHAILWLKDKGQEYTHTCCILSTAPFLREDDINAGYKLIYESNVDTVMSVTKFDFPVFRAFQKDQKGRYSLVE